VAVRLPLAIVGRNGVGEDAQDWAKQFPAESQQGSLRM